VNSVDESFRDLLSVLIFFLFIDALALGESSLGLKSKFSLLSIVFVGLLFHSSKSNSMGVQFFQSSDVLQWVLLLCGVKGSVFFLVSDGVLNGVGVDDLSDIGVGKDSSVEVISGLALGSNSVSTEDFIKGLEGRFSPDDESSEVTTRSELSQVESVDIDDFNTGEVSNSSEEGDVLVAVYEEGSSTESVSSVSELTLARSDGLGVGNSFNIFISTESLQEGNGILGLFNTFEFIVNNQRKVGNILDSVASSENKRSNSRGSEGSSNGMSPLGDIDFSVPSSPGL